MSLEHDVLVKALATTTNLTPEQARETQYDVYALQVAMDLVKPYLSRLGGYRPLLVWLRESYRGGNVTSTQDLKPFKNVRKVFQAYEKINGPTDMRHASKDVRVYVGQQGKYVVCIVKDVDGKEQDQFNDDYTARVIICETAEDVAEVLHQMRLQYNRYEDYAEYLEIKSPLTCVGQGLLNALQAWMNMTAAELTGAKQSQKRIKQALSKVE